MTTYYDILSIYFDNLCITFHSIMWALIKDCVQVSLSSHFGLGWLCFQLISACPQRPLPSQRLLPLTSKPFELNLRYLGQRIYRSGKINWMTFPWPWPKVTAVALTKKKIGCLHHELGTTHSITTKHYWPNYAYYLNTFWRSFIANFLQKFWICFIKITHYFGHLSGIFGVIDVKW